MKRDFLESLGLDKAGIDAIMTENGKSIEALRQRCEALEEENRTLREEKEEALRKAAEDDAEIKRLRDACERAEAFRQNVIAEFIAEAAPASALAAAEIRRLLSEEAERGAPLREALARLKKADPAAFPAAPKPDRPIFSVIHQSGDGTVGFLSDPRLGS